MRGIACAGNWILDLIHDIPAWPEKSTLVEITQQTAGLGGGPANVSAGLTAMGVDYPVVPIGLIGAGKLGDEMLRLADEAGLDTSLIARTDKAHSSQTHVMNVPGDSRTFFHHTGTNDLFGPEHIDMAGLAGRGLKIFYLGYLNLLGRMDALGDDGRPLAAQVLAEARAHGMMTCVDLVSSQSPTFRETVFGALPEIDILFLNEIEAARATGLPQEQAGTLDAMVAAAQALGQGGVRRAVILHSPERILWLEDGSLSMHIPPRVAPQDIVSSVGAGDAFAAGVLHGLHEGWEQGACVSLGCRAATACLKGRTATSGLGAFLLTA